MNPYFLIAVTLVFAVVGVAKGIDKFQQINREREEARKTTVTALQTFGTAYARAQSSVHQSYQLRQELIQTTEEFLRTTTLTEEELAAHLASATELRVRSNAASDRAGAMLKDAVAAIDKAVAAIGKCRAPATVDRLSDTQKTDIAKQVASMTTSVAAARLEFVRLRKLGERCESLQRAIDQYIDTSRAEIARIRQINQAAQDKLAGQKLRQEAMKRAAEKLKAIQAQLSADIEKVQRQP